MKISNKVIIIAVVVFIITATLAVFNTFNRMKREKENFENNNFETNIEEKVDIYDFIENIDENYTMSNAIDSESFIIDKQNNIYNHNKLKSFMDDFANDINTSLRVVSETIDGLFSVLEIQCSGDEILVTQNNIQLSGYTIQNKYWKSDGYTIANELIILTDGTKLESYYLATNGTEEKIDLFAYVIADFENDMINSGEMIE